MQYNQKCLCFQSFLDLNINMALSLFLKIETPGSQGKQFISKLVDTMFLKIETPGFKSTIFLLGYEPLEASDQLHRTRGRLFGRFHNSEMFRNRSS